MLLTAIQYNTICCTTVVHCALPPCLPARTPYTATCQPNPKQAPCISLPTFPLPLSSKRALHPSHCPPSLHPSPCLSPPASPPLLPLHSPLLPLHPCISHPASAPLPPCSLTSPPLLPHPASLCRAGRKALPRAQAPCSYLHLAPAFPSHCLSTPASLTPCSPPTASFTLPLTPCLPPLPLHPASFPLPPPPSPAGRKALPRALELFLQGLTAPTMVCSAITAATYKKYALVSLIHTGVLGPRE